MKRARVRDKKGDHGPVPFLFPLPPNLQATAEHSERCHSPIAGGLRSCSGHAEQLLAPIAGGVRVPSTPARRDAATSGRVANTSWRRDSQSIEDETKQTRSTDAGSPQLRDPGRGTSSASARDVCRPRPGDESTTARLWTAEAGRSVSNAVALHTPRQGPGLTAGRGLLRTYPLTSKNTGRADRIRPHRHP